MAEACPIATISPRRRPPRSRTPSSQTHYYAFLSYSHKDEAIADWLHEELERFRVPRSGRQIDRPWVGPKR